MQFIRNISAVGSIVRIWEGYFGIGGFFRKDWIYFGLEFLGGDKEQAARPSSAPDPVRNNVTLLRDRPKPPPADETRSRALVARRAAR
jgi:hypothetical protein